MCSWGFGVSVSQCQDVAAQGNDTADASFCSELSSKMGPTLWWGQQDNSILPKGTGCETITVGASVVYDMVTHSGFKILYPQNPLDDNHVPCHDIGIIIWGHMPFSDTPICLNQSNDICARMGITRLVGKDVMR